MSTAHLLYGTVLLVCLIVAVRLWQSQRVLYLLLLTLTILALVYDNYVVGFGRFIGEGDLLQSLNLPRYLLHAFFTPLMIMVGFFLARNAGVQWARSNVALYIFGGITVAMIALGTMVDVVNLDLEFAIQGDTMRYANAASEGPPIPAIVSIILLIGCGISIWRNSRWVWLMVGAIVMFIASAGGSAFGVLTNLGELALAISLIYTAKQFPYENLSATFARGSSPRAT